MKTKNAVDKYSEQSTNEQQDLKNVESWMKSEFGEIIKVTVNTKATKNGTINGEEPNTNNPIIPE